MPKYYWPTLLADIVVIRAMVYSFGTAFPLKTWIDHLCRADFPCQDTEAGPVGLVKGKKEYLALFNGGATPLGQ